jgi:hypothetical protein
LVGVRRAIAGRFLYSGAARGGRSQSLWPQFRRLILKPLGSRDHFLEPAPIARGTRGSIGFARSHGSPVFDTNLPLQGAQLFQRGVTPSHRAGWRHGGLKVSRLDGRVAHDPFIRHAKEKTDSKAV